jgi:transcriptional regulator with XRE-family HTH domain
MPEIDRLTGRQIAAGRTLIGMSQAELATASRISVQTLRRMEASEGPSSGYANNVAAVRSFLESAGIEFLNHGRPGVRMKKAPSAISDEAALPDIPETDGEPYDGAPV